MLDNIIWLGHSTIKIKDNKTIYFDPFNINSNYNDADIIFITHNHYDHFSKEDILKCIKSDTKIIITEDLYNNTSEFINKNNIIKVKPNNSYNLDKIKFTTIPAYNINKPFHPKDNNWVGYLLELNNIIYYIAGDTDITEDNKKIKCDIAFLPIGGKFTMDYQEAAQLANIIKPKTVIPIHYGSIIGTKEDAILFKNNIDKEIECLIK